MIRLKIQLYLLIRIQLRKRTHLRRLDHAAVGARLLRTWGLPERLATMVEAHHTGATGEAAILTMSGQETPLAALAATYWPPK